MVLTFYPIRGVPHILLCWKVPNSSLQEGLHIIPYRRVPTFSQAEWPLTLSPAGSSSFAEGECPSLKAAALVLGAGHSPEGETGSPVGIPTHGLTPFMM